MFCFYRHRLFLRLLLLSFFAQCDLCAAYIQFSCVRSLPQLKISSKTKKKTFDLAGKLTIMIEIRIRPCPLLKGTCLAPSTVYLESSIKLKRLQNQRFYTVSQTTQKLNRHVQMSAMNTMDLFVRISIRLRSVNFNEQSFFLSSISICLIIHLFSWFFT